LQQGDPAAVSNRRVQHRKLHDRARQWVQAAFMERDLARMIPNCGPDSTNSKGEPVVYGLLKEQLGDDFTVVHSLPWLSAAAREIADAKAVTGEIDFLIIHAKHGVLAIEVKGGAHRVQSLAFVHVPSGTRTRAVEQVRTSTHGLARWLGVDPSLRLKIGYALVFPHSDFEGQHISAALTDRTVVPAQTIVIDMSTLADIGRRVLEIMSYWRGALSAPGLGSDRMALLLKALCPEFDGTPSWASRVAWDNKLWLRMTTEQSAVVDSVVVDRRLVVTGWPGTGKTLILIESARRLLQQGKRVLVLTFNSLLAEYLRAQFRGQPKLTVNTWHRFCRTQRTSLQTTEQPTKDWLDLGCLEDIDETMQRGRLPSFDTLLIDEAQTFRREWFSWLCKWHSERQLVAFCDSTQVFSFEEERVSLADMCMDVGVTGSFALTIPLRSPKAVLERLSKVIKPQHQLHSPRDFEVEAMEERLVVDMDEALTQTLERLKSEGLTDSDIVVLAKFGWNPAPPGATSTIRHETVSRFRGLEAPAIVVVGAERMDDIELFCAYSRATTLCIALYNAEELGVRGPSCQFHTLLLDAPTNAKEVERARRVALTGEIIEHNLFPVWLGLKTAKIGWLPEWGGWLIEDSNTLSSFWHDYLLYSFPWPVFSWESDSIRSIRLSTPVPNVFGDHAMGRPHEVLFCSACEKFRLHRLDPRTLQKHCVTCSCAPEVIVRSDAPDATIFQTLEGIDELIAMPEPKSLSPAQRKQLPLSLAAAAALTYARKCDTDVNRELDPTPWGRISYRAALAFTYSFAKLQPANKHINVAEVAEDLYQRYAVSNDLTRTQWEKDVKLGFSTAYQKGLLRKVAKGIYATIAADTPATS
jgi:hypothetical protein